MKLSDAQKLAMEVLLELQPHCTLICITGSVRREKEEVKDIEIVAKPISWQTGLFMDGIATVINQWEKVKGDVENDNTVKYTQRVLPGGMKLDLFFANEDNYGAIKLIRTGDWEFSKKFVGELMPKHGLKMQDGHVWRQGKMISVATEELMFKLVNKPFIQPKDRNINAI